MVTRGGYVLRDDPRQFDHAFFGISAVEAAAMDPSQRKLLEVTYEAFDSAGAPLSQLFGSRTGVFVGNFNNEHQLMQFRDPDYPLPYVVTGGGPTILSNRISYVFNLQGPRYVRKGFFLSFPYFVFFVLFPSFSRCNSYPWMDRWMNGGVNKY